MNLNRLELIAVSSMFPIELTLLRVELTQILFGAKDIATLINGKLSF